MLNDIQQRLQATDPAQSFIVQAPAGSGKTEILTQRYLRLLGTVTAPEQIIALTFTRKAANEMRERILRAMQHVAAGAQATSEHQQKTYGYARDALMRDKALDWQLLQQPGRLRIITIDSLCQTLTQAIPLQDKQIHYANISDKPHGLYLQAARDCLAFAIEHATYHHAIKTLLTHLDNRQDYLLKLLTDLLVKRDQWLSSLYQAKSQDKTQFEQAIKWIEQHEITRFRDTLPLEFAQELICLAQQVACIENDPEQLRYPLCNWTSLEQLDARLAASLAALLLTTQNSLRKGFDHHVGLRKGACPDPVFKELKDRSKLLMEQLDSLPDFHAALLRIKNLPDPHYDPEQWDVLQAIFTLLPVLAAHLNLVFAAQNMVDFSAISQQALQALGEDDCPSDLSLYLDNRIHHILVDEFQDTSIQQFQLLEKLVHGWQPDDGRTLFVVGDPMQSIYRFRAAEVGLFLRAKRQGIGHVNLTPLELSCNFRSTATVVDWVNAQFKHIFPTMDDIESGAVSFHASSHIKPADDNSQVQAFQHASREDEAEGVVRQVRQELQQYPQDNIAILVRSRSQLTAIVRALRLHGIPFQGVDIDLLANLPHLRDVWSLTQALLMPASRLAWLALLRSPWCGLGLADLHCIANHDRKKSIYFALSQLDQLTRLSPEGRMRAQFIYTVLHTAMTRRFQQSLTDWINLTLQQLHLTHVLTTAEQDDLEQYWRLLERFEQDGQIADMALFRDEFNQLYSQTVTPSRLQIMTIHKSKGLEFDCVILPGLSARPSVRDTPLLRWLTLPAGEHGELVLLSPIKAAHHDQCLVYDYLGKLEAQKDDYERQRLFYVAVTRAKKRLYLFDRKETAANGSFRSLLLNQEFASSDPASPLDSADHPQTSNSIPLYHLPLDYYKQHPVLPVSEENTSAMVINTSSTPRLIGIVAHELLQWICDHHPASINDIPWELARYSLKATGLDSSELTAAMEQLNEQLTRIFNDPVGQWIIRSHDQEQNEYALLTQHQGDVVTRIIDRTFCDQGIRWIIDFKTGREDSKTQEHHRRQVNEYAELLASRTEAPIRCGIYYLSSGTWVDWGFARETAGV